MCLAGTHVKYKVNTVKLFMRRVSARATSVAAIVWNVENLYWE